MLAHGEEQRVPAAREQAEERRLERIGLEVERRDVALEVVDGDERQPARPGERLRRGEADEQRADEPGPLGDGDSLDVVERHAGRSERLAHDRSDELEVAPRRDLGHDAAVAGVEIGLRRDDEESTRPSSVTTAAAVSSHEVSIPRITTPARTARARAT